MKVLVALLIILLCALQYRLWFGDGSVQEVWRLTEESRAARTELTRLKSRNQALEAEVDDLKSGLEAIEERARAELGMIDEYETFYQFVRERAQGDSSTKTVERDRMPVDEGGSGFETNATEVDNDENDAETSSVVGDEPK
ncbi:MAG: cell division protein FtsB [Granulosicoccus sp.]